MYLVYLMASIKRICRMLYVSSYKNLRQEFIIMLCPLKGHNLQLQVYILIIV